LIIGYLGGVDLVARDGDEVRAERLGPKRQLEKALHGVGMEQRQRTFAARGADHVADGHDRAGLVIDHHHGHQKANTHKDNK